MVRFDLGSLLQGQTSITKLKSAHNSLIIGGRGLQCETNFPVNIRNVFKWFKRLQNVFKTYLNPLLWFSKRFQVNVYAVMFEKRFINILYKNVFTENVSEITQEPRFDWKCF